MSTPGKGMAFSSSEAAALAERVVPLQGEPLNQERRARVAAEMAALRVSALRPYPGSLQEDPQHAGNYYLAVDAASGGKSLPLLLQFTSVGASAARRFGAPLHSERLRTASGREIESNVFPFSSPDHSNLRTFAEEVAPVFLPRPQRALPAIAAGNRHPEISLPAVFDAYREILEKLRVNMASTVQLSATREMTTEDVIAARAGEDPVAIGHTRVSIRHLYHAGLWAAIRAGWREGYTAEADHFIVSGADDAEIARSLARVKEAIRHAAGYTKFTTDSSRMFELQADPRHPQAWSDSVIEEKFLQLFPDKERRWILGEFSQPFRMESATYEFTREEIVRLAVKFGRSLQLNEELFDAIGAEKAGQKGGKEFDFEPSLDEAETLTTAKELLFYMHWLKARGRPAQLVPPNLGFKKRQAYPVRMETTPETGVGLEDYAHHKMWPELVPRVAKEFRSRPIDELAARVAELAAVARYFDGTLSIHSGSGKQGEVLECIGRSTKGRVNYKISGELQLQLLDVLSEQPAGSPWRRLFERMVSRANRFAAAGAFGSESELAAQYVKMGREFYLGDSSRGRVEGNLFLVFWLGNVVGSRDAESPDGDRRFFKEKLDELPEGLLAEVRRRNSRYVVWLAGHLHG